MPFRERVNNKTGKRQYKYRYYYIRDGKKRDSETGWFDTKERAEREGRLLKREKEKEELNRIAERRDRRIENVYEDYIKYREKEYDRTMKTTDKRRLSLSKTILRKHIPQNIKNTRMREISGYTFRSWISSVNRKSDLSGSYIRLVKNALSEFNKWVDEEGYYIDDEMSEKIAMALSKANIKPIKEGNREERGDRHILSMIDIENITKYYIDKGLGAFKNFYYYTLFYVLFFSGMRPEEIVGLQWKGVDLRESERTISIVNAISEKEDRAYALKRTKEGKLLTKNKTSIRRIPIFDYYYRLLKDYKESYRYEFDLNDEDLDECFVFCRLTKRNPYEHLDAQKIRYQIKKLEREIGLPKTDIQMFRHSCAMFLILTPPDGLGYTEEKVMDYFGHTDTKMLQSVYARLTAIQKSERMKYTFKDIYKPDEKEERTIEEEAKQRIIARVNGDNDREMMDARRHRIFNQINYCIKQNRKVYYYSEIDYGIIQEYINENGNVIKFEKEEFRPKVESKINENIKNEKKAKQKYSSCEEYIAYVVFEMAKKKKENPIDMFCKLIESANADIYYDKINEYRDELNMGDDATGIDIIKMYAVKTRRKGVKILASIVDNDIECVKEILIKYAKDNNLDEFE